jgi:hypothetical protein
MVNDKLNRRIVCLYCLCDNDPITVMLYYCTNNFPTMISTDVLIYNVQYKVHMKMFFILYNIRWLEIKINLTCLSEKLISRSFKLEKSFYSCNYKHQMTFILEWYVAA